MDSNTLKRICNAMLKAGIQKEDIAKMRECACKQIGEIPTLESDGYYDGEPVYDTWYCPDCGTRYDLESESDKYDFCPYCGKAILWIDPLEEMMDRREEAAEWEIARRRDEYRDE